MSRLIADRLDAGRLGAGAHPVAPEPSEVAALVEPPRTASLSAGAGHDVHTDLVLPGTDGIALMQTLPALAEVPVIFLSACGRGDTVARALEAGAADYIVKPFSAAELVARTGASRRRRTGPETFVIPAPVHGSVS